MVFEAINVLTGQHFRPNWKQWKKKWIKTNSSPTPLSE
jgi:hypothetical protein